MAAILEDGIGWRRTSWKSLKSFTRMGSWMVSLRPKLVVYPKKKTQKRFLTSDWSALLQVYTKLLLVLVHPIISALHNTIEDHQMAFIEGRQILDSALIANEVVEEYRAQRKKWVVLKIDFAKAYNHVDWDFLDFVFDRRWRTWIRGCLSSINFLIIVNDRPRGKFRGSRGLRHHHFCSIKWWMLWARWLIRQRSFGP